jgi:hypothetical protein
MAVFLLLGDMLTLSSEREQGDRARLTIDHLSSTELS